MNALLLVVWRDSVCMGDDCDAPHELSSGIPADATLRQAVERIPSNYLASIAGGCATWILEARRRPLAVFAQQWRQPRFVADPNEPLAAFIDLAAKPHLDFRYWCQVDPERVYGCLQRGEPLPDKYGR